MSRKCISNIVCANLCKRIYSSGNRSMSVYVLVHCLTQRNALCKRWNIFSKPVLVLSVRFTKGLIINNWF